jgi:hypothetical protein
LAKNLLEYGSDPSQFEQGIKSSSGCKPATLFNGPSAMAMPA